MNYWLLTTEYPPFHGGGISTYCHFTALMLAEMGHKVTVFVQDDGIRDWDTSSNNNPGITLCRFNSNRNRLHTSLGYAARLSYEFADIVKTFIDRDGRPDIIEAQDYLGIAYYLTQQKHLGYPYLNDIPIAITLHSPAFIYLEYNRVPTYRFPDFWTGEMEKQAIGAADLLISPTRFLVEEISNYIDISCKPVHILANPYTPPELPTPSRFTRNKIVYYGKLSPQKGSFELLKYFKDLWDEGFPHPLCIIGGTDIVYHPEMQTMGQLVARRYGSYIKKGLLQLHGKIRPDQIKDTLEDAHVILFPSTVDNLPYVVMETMSLGKVVLASKQGGQREMMEDGVSGFLFDHNEPGSFARQLQKILALPDQTVHQIGIAARHFVKKSYSFETIGPKKVRLLQEVSGARSEDRHFPFLHQEKTTAPAGIPSGNHLLSVVIPYYNMGPYIEECIRSVENSTYPDIEILVINDGSTDNSSLRTLALLEGRGKIRVIHQKNQGLALTRNEGARQARGTFLAFLDADDKVDPLYYEKTIRALKMNDNVYFAGSWVRYFENRSQLWPTFTPQPPYALVHNPLNSSGLVYKRAAFIAGGLNDPLVDYGLEDYESVISMLHQGFNGVVLPEVLFHYRVRTDSMFRAITREKLLYSNKYIAEKHADYYAKFAVQTVNLLNANGPGYLFDNPTLEVRVSATTAKENALLLKMKSFVKGNQQLKKIVLTIKKFNR